MCMDSYDTAVDENRTNIFETLSLRPLAFL